LHVGKGPLEFVEGGGVIKEEKREFKEKMTNLGS